jgi:DNA-binding beta-propeller fold protein YncE
MVRPEYYGYASIALDRGRNRLIVADAWNDRLLVFSADESFAFREQVGGISGTMNGWFNRPTGLAIDEDRNRILVSDTLNSRIQVFAADDYSFRFAIKIDLGRGSLKMPFGICVDHLGRIIVADDCNKSLHAYSPEGSHISSFFCGKYATLGHVAYCKDVGLIAYTDGHSVSVIRPDEWLPDSGYVWRVEYAALAPWRMQLTVRTLTKLRSVALQSTLSLLPNELLFQIFAFL